MTIEELEAIGAVWVDRNGDDASECQHEVKVAPLSPGGVALVHCVKCLKTAEQILGGERGRIF